MRIYILLYKMKCFIDFSATNKSDNHTCAIIYLFMYKNFVPFHRQIPTEFHSIMVPYGSHDEDRHDEDRTCDHYR